METVFIINPKAGQGADIGNLTCNIKKAGAKVYITQAVGDATNYVREYCKTFGSARFIACGGDGTLSEVVNGAIDIPGTEIGVLPLGTGNDFCRNFRADFCDVAAQMTGDTIKCDAIRYITEANGVKKIGYCINMFNIGFDCNVVDMTASMKKKPFIFGSLAYFLSIIVTLVKKKGANLKIEVDGEVKNNGPLLLTSIANGCYCGGGVKSNPLASVQDGFLNINIINDVSRVKFIRLLPYYMKGTFLNLPNIEKVISSLKCKKIVITPLDGKIRLCNDGEIFDAGRCEFEIVHNAFNFVIPQKTFAFAH